MTEVPGNNPNDEAPAGRTEPYGREGLPLVEARQQVLAGLNPCRKTQTIDLDQALGRVCARPVLATATVPGFRASIMDGYALGQSHQPSIGDSWSLRGRAAAGAPFQAALSSGEAIRILTGAPLPADAGWVLPQELVEAEGGRITLIGKASDQAWIRAADEECSAGDALLQPGHRLQPADQGRLASCGIAQITVHERPRIGLLISGDELLPAGAERSDGMIWESNGTLLEALLANLGQLVIDRRVVADQPDALRAALLDLAANCDVVVSTGGVSAGDTDWIRPLVAELGSVAFWKLFLKPGRPFAFGALHNGSGPSVPFFGLPGNPVAAAITALQLLWPALQLLEGQTTPELFPRLKVTLINPLRRRPGRPELARARMEVDDSGALLARTDGSQASSRIGSLVGADLLLEIPAEAGPLEPGCRLWAQLIRRRLL